MGKHGVNIAAMSLSRDVQGGHALTVLNLDSVPGQPLLEELINRPEIRTAQASRCNQRRSTHLR